MSLYRLVEVIWHDAMFDIDERVGVVVMHTVGWLLRDSDTEVLVAGERSADSDYLRSYTAIPRECIVSMKELKTAAKK